MLKFQALNFGGQVLPKRKFYLKYFDKITYLESKTKKLFINLVKTFFSDYTSILLTLIRHEKENYPFRDIIWFTLSFICST